jgi:hypothetical protein
VYYSNYLFRSSSGTWQERPTTDSDIINLGPAAYNILFYELCSLLPPEIGGEDSSFDADYYDRKLNGDGNEPGLYERYGLQYPSEEIQGQSTYYKFDDI